VLKQMEIAGSTLNLVILDACRNNPFGGRGLRDAGQGLAVMRAPRGTLISYATQPGNVALDGTTGHSPYTAALAETIRRPGLQVLEVFNEVGLAVDQATGGRQQPWVASSPLDGVFYFLGPTTVNIAPPSAAQPTRDAEIVFWQSISQSNNPADFEEYLRKFPQGQFSGLARNRLAALHAPAPAASSVAETLLARFSTVLPAIDQKRRQVLARAYEAFSLHKALAASLEPPGTWAANSRPDADNAEEGALEQCQVLYGQPCILLAVDQDVKRFPADGK
jgi:Caspase domain